MNIFSRILLAVYAICLMVISALTMIMVFKIEILEVIYKTLLRLIESNRSGSIVLFIIAFIFFGLSLTFLLSGFRSNKDKKAVSKHTNIGEIKITLNTIENIALNASKRLSGVRDTKAYVHRVEDSVAIIVNAVVMPDVNIPELSQDIQLRVKKSVEDSAGINVHNVKVLIENIYTGTVYKARVE